MILSRIYDFLYERDYEPLILIIVGIIIFVSLFAYLPCQEDVTWCFYGSWYIPLAYVIIGGIILTELFFWLDKKPRDPDSSKILYTIGKKLECLFKTGLIILVLNGIIVFINYLKIGWATILKVAFYTWLGIMGLAIVIGLLWLYIKLNSLKYRDKPKRRKK